MFVQVFVPNGLGQDDLRFLWIAHKAIDKMKFELCLVSPESYWQNVDEVVELVRSAPPSDYDYLKSFGPSQQIVDRLAKKSITWPALSGHSSAEAVWAQRLTEVIPEIADELINVTRGLDHVEAIMTWANCSTLSRAAEILDCPIIHNEVGPLRPPYYKATAYFDFAGVGRATESEKRWNQFRNDTAGLPLYPRHQLKSLFSGSEPSSSALTRFRVGVSLQDREQEILSGISNERIVEIAHANFGDSILMRPHPAQHNLRLDTEFECDKSSSSLEFISRVDSLLTVNSGIGLEAMLCGKPVFALGDPPYKHNTWDLRTKSPLCNPLESEVWMNWFLFCYLIPFDYLFDVQYYRWRLSRPTEIEIYNAHHSYWTGQLARPI